MELIGLRFPNLMQNDPEIRRNVEAMVSSIRSKAEVWIARSSVTQNSRGSCTLGGVATSAGKATDVGRPSVKGGGQLCSQDKGHTESSELFSVPHLALVLSGVSD